MALFHAERHEPLTRVAWDAVAAQTAVQRIVNDCHTHFQGDALWPIHPLDRSAERPSALTTLYYGAAGVMWALDYLGALQPLRGYEAALATLVNRNHDDAVRLRLHYPFYLQYQHAYLMGEVGLLMVRCKLTPDVTLEDQLQVSLERHLNADPVGLGWGVAGTALAAWLMFERTAQSRWHDLYVRSGETLWRSFALDAEFGCHLWTQDLYGTASKQLGGLHGFAANALPLLLGRHTLPNSRAQELVERVAGTLAATAVRDERGRGEGGANWPHVAGGNLRNGLPNGLVQHCIGAPGIINCLATLPKSADVDALFTAGGALIWDAGPNTKLPSLCHGIPGSGYAFLHLFERTGDPKWLERARRFAMHAIAQNDRAVSVHGQRKYSLWTGDLGLAVYLSHCIKGTPRFPTVEVF